MKRKTRKTVQDLDELERLITTKLFNALLKAAYAKFDEAERCESIAWVESQRKAFSEMTEDERDEWLGILREAVQGVKDRRIPGLSSWILH